MAFLLFLLMSGLISDAAGFTPKERTLVTLDIFQDKPDEIFDDPDEEPPDEPEPVEELDLPTIDISNETESPEQIVGMDFPTIGPSPGPGGALSGGPWSRGNHLSEGRVVCVVCISPQYPSSALGKEGWVELEFTVTSAGTVIDAVVVDAKPNRVFNRSALRAIYRSKFKPRVVDGVATEQRARQRYQFVMESRD